MTATGAERAAMRHAIALSALGLGTTSPNPPVGCVILDKYGDVVGTGYHQRKGEPHAEGHALGQAADRARGGTAVVTLEPCNHEGATPACRQLLLDAGIRRVVIALIDPTSRGDGGAAELNAAGVDVEVGTLAEEARVVLQPWLTATIRQRPFVTLYLAGDIQADCPGDLRGTHDIVMLPEGTLEEGITGGHSRGSFTVPGTPALKDEPEETLKRLYAAGARTVLVVTGRGPQHGHITSVHADRVVAEFDRDVNAAEPQQFASLVPGGFSVTDTYATSHSMRLAARAERPEQMVDSDSQTTMASDRHLG